MTSDSTGGEDQDLRRRALHRLTGETGPYGTRLNAAPALRALYDLASCPSTGAHALALLHELQVYQVELDLQNEELNRSRAELETSLARQLQLYDCAPVGSLTIDRSTRLIEINLTAAGMLGGERSELLGRNLESFLAVPSMRALHAMLGRVSDGVATASDALQLIPTHGAPRSVHACATRDPDGERFLLAFAG